MVTPVHGAPEVCWGHKGQHIATHTGFIAAEHLGTHRETDAHFYFNHTAASQKHLQFNCFHPLLKFP